MRKISLTLAVTVLFALSLSGSAHASDGYFSLGYGTKHKGMGGIGIAIPMSPLVMATNPAALVYFGNGFEVSLAVFNPLRDYTVTGTPSGMAGTFPLTPGKIESDSKYFLIPAFGASWKIDDVSAFGIGVYGNGGMNTDYDTKTFNNPMAPVTQPTGVNLSQLFAALSYAREIAPNHAVGVSGILSYQMFKANGLQAFSGFSSDAGNLTDNDTANSFGFGARVGYMGWLTPKLSIGAAYQTKMFMSEFDEYGGLFAEQGDFDIPANWTVGFAYRATDKALFGFDIQHIMYSDVASVGNPMNPAAMMQGVQLGSDAGAGFGWKDMTVFKAGGQYTASDLWSFRAGYSYGEQPVPESEVMFNILAPGIIEHHITVGASRIIGGREISFAAMRALSSSVTGANPMEVPGAQSIELRMDQWEFEFSIAF